MQMLWIWDSKCFSGCHNICIDCMGSTSNPSVNADSMQASKDVCKTSLGPPPLFFSFFAFASGAPASNLKQMELFGIQACLQSTWNEGRCEIVNISPSLFLEQQRVERFVLVEASLRANLLLLKLWWK